MSEAEGTAAGTEIAGVFTRIEDVPIDEAPEREGDDGRNADQLRASAQAVDPGDFTPRNAPLKAHRFVPLLRNLKRNDRGPDVFAVQRMLRVLQLRTEPPTGTYGESTEREVRGAQEMYEVTVDGEYGAETHGKVAAYFDAYGSWLLGRAPHADDKETALRAIVAAAMLGYQRREEIHYTQGPLRMQGVNARLYPPRFPHYADCSSFFTWCYFTAGAPDPNGRGYNGEGYTGTLYEHGRAAKSLDRGYAALYGPPTGCHVAIGVGGGKVVSHGSEGGPYLLDTAEYRSDLHQLRAYL